MIKKAVDRIKLLKKAVKNVIYMDIECKYNTKKSLLEYLSLNSKLPLIDTNSELIVSFTTYSSRLNDVHLVVESIGQQTVKPGRIILWLDETEFDKSSIPEILKLQIDRGLEIRFCKNYRSYKKLIPTVELLGKSCEIITIDDDILYPYYFVEELVKESKAHEFCTIAYRCHNINATNGNIGKYSTWEINTAIDEPGINIFPTGVGGIYYPSGSLDKLIIDFSLIDENAPFADDIWFYLCTRLAGFKTKKISREVDFDSEFLTIPASMRNTLAHSNVGLDKNDIQMNSSLSALNLKDFYFD
ncbi:hypothetical protein [Vibrio furnissii]|uniref:hypothetical protein n=1 Tax=Vibrio furnissii TaxID=29494 RepID=UPI001EEC158A|nr:hypothetical protein [Vibrio furnissii]